jgi:hypothetical protein
MDGLPGPFPCPCCGEIIAAWGIASFGDRREPALRPALTMTICTTCYTFLVVDDPVRVATTTEVAMLLDAYPEAGELIVGMLMRDPDFTQKVRVIFEEATPPPPRRRRQHRRRR